ncbi:hypothetical protein B4119_4324 [Parageobacillus caldoxylosilyticus]|uniref:Uncharacterized protein n=1 Tax=Saccharococcus caldoxylosilyticus TaxID=81408 RepID=A0A150L5G2_9BACL|nr:hypothetical protein B4119_4324 [Parageobacillus caldoxylosilyticus]
MVKLALWLVKGVEKLKEQGIHYLIKREIKQKGRIWGNVCS